MRSPGLLFVVAACSSSASDRTPDATTSYFDAAIGLTCGTTIAAYCDTRDCDQSLAAAEQDHNLCPASQNTCGAFEVIVRGGVDTETIYYYQGDQLTAIVNRLLPGHRTCAAGPAMFEEPSCDDSSQTLPICTRP